MNLFKGLQKIGKALMVPVSVLPVAGILVALGRLLESSNGVVSDIGHLLFNGGISVFENLPLIFALGVVIGFADEAIAVLAAGVGYIVYQRVLVAMANLINISQETAGSIDSINTGVFGGIVIGILAAIVYNKFHDLELPPYLGLFSRKRLVPIITAMLSLLTAILFSFIWPSIQIKINSFARFAMDSSIGPALYAAGKRALIPTGLHHVYYSPFLYEFGRFVTESGEVLKGESARYFAGDSTAGYFMASEFPIMLFGLPAASLAIYLRALPKKKKAVAGIMTTAALTSILTGITEPIEFTFIFVAPLLYFFHVGMAFISGLMTKAFEIRLGYAFSASVFDYVLGTSNAGNPLSFWLIVGPIIGLSYFIVFYYTISYFDIKTPGRTREERTVSKLTIAGKAEVILKALGGADNIKRIDACITRLRLEVGTPSLIDEEGLKSLGAVGVVKLGNNIQVVFGTESDTLKDEIRKLL